MEEERKNFILTIANEVNTILKNAGVVAMSWGISDKAATEFEGMAALAFNVNGFRHRGGVVVALNEAKDLYECYFLNEKGEAVNVVEDVYLDELVSVLDREIETGDEDEKTYTEKVNKWFEKNPL